MKLQQLLGCALSWLLATAPACRALLFPAASNMNLISTVSCPVVEYFPERRILIDWGFAMGYDLPSQLSSFYNIPIWPGFQNPKGKRAIADEQPAQQSLLRAKYDRKVDSNRHAADFSAGELYQGIEDFMTSHGFDDTCLLRAVCELARHPFDDDHKSILIDVLTFLLTPSMHRGFDGSEQLYRETYEDAEMQGFLARQECATLYPKCRKNFLGLITEVVQ